MKRYVKNVSTTIFLAIFVLMNSGITNALLLSNHTMLAYEDNTGNKLEEKKKEKKEFRLSEKYSGKKLEKLKGRIEGKENYKIVIQSEKTQKELKEYYKTLDQNIKVKKVGKGLFQLKIPKNSVLSGSFNELPNGNLPESIGDEKVVEPEVFESFDSEYLSGESVANLPYLNQIGANTFQEELQTKEKIKVGIMDTGIETTHPDLVDNFNTSLSYHFIDDVPNANDENGHGTQVAGIVGAKVNGTGIYGVNSNSDLVALKVLDNEGFGTSYDVLEAIDYAMNNHIKILNISFGGTGDPATSPVCQAITEAKNVGIFTVVSAGNNNTDVSNIVPAGCSDAITVGSFGESGTKSSFSNFGNGVDVYAPGENMYTTDKNNSYTTKNGTSFSAPLVAGIISKELAYNPALSYDEILGNMKNNYGLKTSFEQTVITETSTGSIENASTGNTLSGTISPESNTGGTLSGATFSGSSIDYSKMKYFSGYFIHEGKTYGNSLYDERFSFSQEELKGIQVFTYEEYQNIQKSTKKEFSAMSIPTDGLVGKWDLNGNALDSSGNGNHGTPVNVTWVDSGRGDGKKVANFNGVDSYINYGNILDEDGTDSFSISVRKKNNLDINGWMVSKQSDTMGNAGYSLSQIGGQGIHFTMQANSSDYLQAKIDGTYSDGNWHNIIVTYDGSKDANGIHFYVDGVLKTKTILKETLIGSCSSNTNFIVGSLTPSFYQYNGNIQNVRKINHVLSTSEIQALYQEGAEKETIDLNKGLVGKWDLNGNANDTSGNGNNGIPINIGWGNHDATFSQNTGIDLPNTISYNGDVSFAGRMKINSGNGSSYGGDHRIIVLSDSNKEIGIWVGNENRNDGYKNKIAFAARNGSGPSVSSWSQDIILDKWYFVAGTRSGNQGKLYVDGNLVSTSTWFTDTIYGDYNAIGYKRQSQNNFSDSNIKLLKIYNRSLSSSEIQALYQEGAEKETIDLNKGLVGKWDLNGNANDTSGNGNNGVVHNVAWIESGRGDGKKVGNFNGVDGKIQISNNSYNNFSGPFTISHWINAKEFPSLANPLISSISKYDTWPNPGGYDIQFYNNSGEQQINFLFVGAEKNSLVTYDHSLKTDTRYHLLAMYDGNKEYIYLNGNEVASNIVPFSVIPNTKDLFIGGFGSYTPWATSDLGRYFNGKISNIRMYNRALSSSEIQALYQEGLSGGSDNNTANNTPQISMWMCSATIRSPAMNHGDIDGVCTKMESNKAANYFNNQNLKQDSPTDQAQTNHEGDPVNLATGEFDYENTLMSIPGKKLPYEFKLSYRNQLSYNGPVGLNWDHNYNQYLTQDGSGNVTFYNGKLGMYRFTKNGENFEYNPGLKANLSMEANNYVLKYDNGNMATFNSEKKIQKLQEVYGNNLQFAYSGGLLSQVTDTLGRKIEYRYFDHNRLQEIVDFNGKKVEFTYFDGTSSSGSLYDLKSIKMTNSAEKSKNISFEYDTNHNISKLIDSKGQTYVENTYDENNRVKTQKYGDGTISYDYTLSGSQVTKNIVTDREGNIAEYSYDERGNNTESKHFNATGSTTFTYTYNDLGYLTSEIRPQGNGYQYEYDTKGNLIEKRFKADLSQPNNDENDIVTKYAYDPIFNKIISQTTPNGTKTENILDNKGNITQTKISGIKDFDGNAQNMVIQNTFNTGGYLIKTIEPNGNTLAYTYSGGLLTKTISGSGTTAITHTFSYDQYGNLLKTTDGNNYATTLNYTEFNQLKSIQTPAGTKSQFEYDENNNKISQEILISSGVTAKTLYEYDVLDKPISMTSDIDATSTINATFKYDGNGATKETQIGTGAKTKFEYNEFGKITKQIVIPNPNNETENIITQFAYDHNGNLTQKIDPMGNTTFFEYDPYDQLLQATDSLGNITTFSYDKNGNILTQTFLTQSGETLQKTQNIYDELNRPIQVIQYNGATEIKTSKVKYDINGKVKESYDGKGNKTTYEYDNFSRLIQSIDPAGNKTMYLYDKNNNILSTQIIAPNTQTITNKFTYERDNRLTKKQQMSTFSGSLDTLYSYDKFNNITRITDSNGNYTIYSYDYQGKKTRETQYINQRTASLVTKYFYDQQGNIIKVTDPKNQNTIYEYNSLNQLTKIIHTDGTFELYEYDKNGNIIKTIDPNGTIVHSQYDDLNRLTQKNILAGTGVLGTTQESYEYDALGRLTKGTNQTQSGILSEVLFGYDNFGNLTKETNNDTRINYEYDENNNLTNISSSGILLTYEYDQINRLKKVFYNGNIFADYTHTGLTIESTKLSNETQTLYTYDEYFRTKTSTTTSPFGTIHDFSYSYDKAGNILSDGQKNYAYDEIYRLLSATGGVKNETFAYDKAGNRMSNTKENLNSTYKTNTLNQYLNQRNELPAGNIQEKNFKYDKNGNLIEDEKQKYEYDYKNKLIRVTDKVNTGKITEFVYDVLGRRIEKKVGNIQTIKYTYSNENILIEQTQRDDKTYTKRYVNGIGIDEVLGYENESLGMNEAEYRENLFCKNTVLPNQTDFESFGYTGILNRCAELGAIANNSEITKNVYYFGKDHLGNIVSLTNETGKLLLKYEYDSYGKVYVKSGSGFIEIEKYQGNLYENTRLFTGREFDKEIGLYYYRARYYSAELGRFISRDPIGQNDDVNLYAYVGNNSVMFVDLMGREKKSFIKENEGNARYIDKSFFYSEFPYYDYGHSALYYISGGEEHLVSLYPEADGKDVFSLNGVKAKYMNDARDDIPEYYEYVKSVGKTSGNVDSFKLTFIDKRYIDTGKIASWQTEYEGNPNNKYNTYLNNCSGEVTSALREGGFFPNATTFVRFPSELTIDIRVQLQLLEAENNINDGISEVENFNQYDLVRNLDNYIRNR